MRARPFENVIRRLGMVTGDPEASHVEPAFVRSFVPVRAERDAWWEPTIAIGDHVPAGDRVGVLRDVLGHASCEVTAPVDGVCLVLTTSPATPAGSVLAYLGTGLAAAP